MDQYLAILSGQLCRRLDFVLCSTKPTNCKMRVHAQLKKNRGVIKVCALVAARIVVFNFDYGNHVSAVQCVEAR